MMSAALNPLDVKQSSHHEREVLRSQIDVRGYEHSDGGKETRNPQEETPVVRKKDDATEDDVIPPDGGWGWLVAFGSFVNMVISGMLITTFGLLYSSMFKEFEVTSTKASWIFNINQFLWNSSAMLGGPLTAHFGWRKVAMSGGALISMATILTAFILNPNYLFVTFSLLTGLGQGLVAVVSLVVVPHYFDSKRGFAVGFTGSGNCVGQFVGPPLVKYLMEHYGFSGTMLILGGICLHAIVVSSLYHPVEWHAKKPKTTETSQSTITAHRVLNSQQSDVFVNLYPSTEVVEDSSLSFELYKERRRNSSIHSIVLLSPALESRSSLYLGNIGVGLLKDSSVTVGGIEFQKNNSGWEKFTTVVCQVVKNILLLKWFRVQIITITLSLVVSTYINFLMLVPFAMVDEGHPLELVSNCLAVAGIFNLVARSLITTLTDFVPFSNKYFFMGGAFGIFVSINCFTLVSSAELIYVTMSVFGASVGACCCLTCLIILEFMGFEYLPQVLGIEGLMNSISFLIFAPIVGAIRDLTQSYAFTIRTLSLAPLISFGVWFLMPCAISRDKKREDVSCEKYLDY